MENFYLYKERALSFFFINNSYRKNERRLKFGLMEEVTETRTDAEAAV